MIATDVVPEQSGGLQLGALPEVPGPLTTVQTVCDEVHNVMDLPISDEVGMDLPSDGPSRISSTEPLTTPNDDVMDLDFLRLETKAFSRCPNVAIDVGVFPMWGC